MKKRAVQAFEKLLGCRTLGGGKTDGTRDILKACFFSYVATQQSASQQSTLRKLDRVKEFLRKKSKLVKVGK